MVPPTIAPMFAPLWLGFELDAEVGDRREYVELAVGGLELEIEDDVDDVVASGEEGWAEVLNVIVEVVEEL